MQKQLLNKKTSLDEVVYFMPYEVPLPHYSVRPMRFGSRGLSEFPGRCRQITFFLRWLDWIFLGRNLPSLSLNYVGFIS